MRYVVVAVSLFTLAVLPDHLLSTARAQQNSVTITKTASANPGEATGEGSYTLADGYSIKEVIMLVWLKDQIVASDNAASIDKTTKTWKGLVIGLKSGETYELQAQAWFEADGLLNLQSSAKMKVTVK
ncbi:MAG TPA: hypothetical protein V6D08_14805 [Candidatus Obscuribacterales bacterium]